MEAARLKASPSIDKYLSIVSIISRSRINAFKWIGNIKGNKLGNQKYKFLSTVRKKILIKFVLQAMPTYNTSVFLLPKNLCHQLHSLFVKFWWDSQNNYSRIHLKQLRFLSCGKFNGGLGFRDLGCFNLAVLVKQAQRSNILIYFLVGYLRQNTIQIQYSYMLLWALHLCSLGKTFII